MPDLEITQYSPDWPRLFGQLRDQIAKSLLDARIEHIGGTAVPGTGGRPVIDVMVGLRHWPPSDEDMAALMAAGLNYHPSANQPGWMYFKPNESTSQHHVYVVRYGSPQWDTPIALRDYLRTYPAEATAYADMKRRLAIQHNEGRHGYGAGKAAFFDDTLGRVWAWNAVRLKAEADAIMKRLSLPDALQEYGIARLVGSYSTGLLVRRDIDIHVLAHSSDLYLTINPIYRRFLDRKDIHEVRISDDRSASGLKLRIENYPGQSGSWEIDIMATHRMERTRFAMDERIQRDLTADQRSAIFRIKGDYYRRGKLASNVSLNIYRAVLDSGVRTPAEFDRYIGTAKEHIKA